MKHLYKVFLCVYCTAMCLAQDGTPVAGFGNNGYKLVSPNPESDFAFAFTQTASGNIMVGLQTYDENYVSKSGVQYLNDEADPITSIGINGFSAHAWEGSHNSYDIKTDFNGNSYHLLQKNDLAHVAIARQLPNGMADLTFGTNGFFELLLEQRTDLYRMKIDAQGRLVVVGITSDNSTYVAPIVFRVNTNGTLDNTFDGDGIKYLKNTGYGRAADVLIDQQGAIYVSGYHRPDLTSSEQSHVWKLDVNGNPVSTFGINGELVLPNLQVYDLIHASAFDPTESYIYFAGYSYNTSGNYDAYICKINSDGKLDSSFDGDGVRIYSYGTNMDLIYGISCDDAGYVYTCGTTYINAEYNAFVSKFDAEGNVVSSFGNNGSSIFQLSSNSTYAYSNAYDIELDPLGDLLVLSASYINNKSKAGILKLHNTVNKSYSGNALYFDGAQRALTLYNSNSSLGTADFTIEAIVQVESTSSAVYPTIISNRTTGKFGIRFAVWDGNKYSKGKLYVRIGAELPIVDINGISVNDGYCHHIAVRRQGTSIQFFVDGQLSGTYATSYAYDAGSSRGYWIGNDFLSPDESYFKGYIRNVRVWKKSVSDLALSKNRFVPLTGLENGLVACWNLNEENTQVFADLSSSNQHGTLGKNTSVEALDPYWSTVKCGAIAVRNAENEQPIQISSYDDESESAANLISVAPNPSSNQFAVLCESLNQDNITITITASTGATIQSITNYRGEVIHTNLPAGIYLISATDGVNRYNTNLTIVR